MHILQPTFSLNSHSAINLGVFYNLDKKFLLTLHKQTDNIASEQRKEDKNMSDMTFADSFGMLVADYDKYSNKMIHEGKEPVSLIKYALGNF